MARVEWDRFPLSNHEEQQDEVSGGDGQAEQEEDRSATNRAQPSEFIGFLQMAVHVDWGD